jgi:hypothetical protein
MIVVDATTRRARQYRRRAAKLTEDAASAMPLIASTC